MILKFSEKSINLICKSIEGILFTLSFGAYNSRTVLVERWEINCIDYYYYVFNRLESAFLE